MASRPLPNADASRPDTFARIQQAAVRLFAAKGFEATGIREIADQAGVQTSALYHYMNSKEDLLLEILVSILKKLIECAESALDGVEGPSAELVSLVRAHVGLHAYDKLEALVGDVELRSLKSDRRVQVIAYRDQYEAIWSRVLHEGRESGEFDVFDKRFARLALLEMCNGVAHWYSLEGALSVDSLADAFADLALGMVRANRSGRPLRVADLGLRPASEILTNVQVLLAGR